MYEILIDFDQLRFGVYMGTVRMGGVDCIKFLPPNTVGFPPFKGPELIKNVNIDPKNLIQINSPSYGDPGVAWGYRILIKGG